MQETASAHGGALRQRSCPPARVICPLARVTRPVQVTGSSAARPPVLLQVRAAWLSCPGPPEPMPAAPSTIVSYLRTRGTATRWWDVQARPPAVLVCSNRVPALRRILPGMTSAIALARSGPVRPTLGYARCANNVANLCSAMHGAALTALRNAAVVTGEGGRPW